VLQTFDAGIEPSLMQHNAFFFH